MAEVSLKASNKSKIKKGYNITYYLFTNNIISSLYNYCYSI